MIKRHLKSIFALVLCLLMVSGTYMAVVADTTPERIVFHVSTTGDDSNPGTAEKPFATIEQASKVVAATEHYGIPVDVLIHGGEYRLNNVINISGAAAGGSEGAPVTYKAAGDGEVVFNGFKDIDVNQFHPVTDEKMRERFEADALPFIGALDLKAQGFDRNNLDMLYNQSKLNSPPDTIEYLVLLLNGKEQWISQWPNYGEFAIFNEVVNSGSGDQMPVAKYDDPTFDRWQDPSTAIVRGYLSNVYLEQWNRITDIDKENKTLTFKYIGTGGVKPGRTWRVLNVPEELNVPGEYFVDVETMTLYFYPPYKISKDDKMELSVSKDVYLMFKETQYINIEGIHFRGFRIDVRPYGLININGCDNMQVRNCMFTYNGGGSAIQLRGFNNIIEANRFYNTGALGIFIANRGYSLEENFPNLEHENNQILNNHFYNTGNENIQGSGYAVTTGLTSWYISNATVGNVVKNNLIHHIYGGMNILYGRGNEWDISYNEVSNGLRTLADYGLIYAGAREDAFGTQVNYNYLHDFVSALDPSYACNGIYFDDWISGQTANNNIIIAGGEGSTNAVFSVGAYNTEKYNISATGRTGVMMSQRDTKYGSNSNHTKIVNALRDLPDVLDKYDYMSDVYDVAMEDGRMLPVGATVIGNVTVDAKNNVTPEAVKYGTVSNNYVGDDYSIFVDHENHDWRIKADVAKELGFDENIMTDENFDMDLIGIQKDVMDLKNPLEPFRQVYPKNGEYGVSHQDVQLAWQPALFADEYDYVVATDPELKNIVASGTTVFEFANIGDLELGKSYYWKVTARNCTKQIGAEWESEGVPFLFTTTNREKVNKSFLETSLALAEKAFADVVDGTGKPGEFKEGTEERFNTMLANARHIYNSYVSSQESVDEINAQLKSAMNGISAFKNKNFITFDTSTTDMWKAANDSTTVDMEGSDTVVLNGGGTVAYKGTVANHNLLKFKMNADLSASWAGFTLRQDSPTANVWGGTKYLIVAKADVFEFQKYQPGASATGVLETKPNDGIIESGQWYDIEFGVADADGGVQVFFKVNGDTVFDFYDTENPVYTPGYFCVKPGNGELKIKAADSLPEEYYDPPADIAERGASIVYTQSSAEYTSESKWKSNKDTTMGYNEKGAYLSESKQPSASYLIKGKREDKAMFYYWHEAVEEGDKNATMTLTFNFDGTGDVVLTRKIDFTRGQSGWTPIGALPFNDFGGNGTVKIEIAGSGEGKVVLPVIKKTNITAERAEFGHLFYRSATNLVALKIGSGVGFINGGDVEIAGTSAQIINNKTYLPLRFLADAFGYDVSWDGGAFEATVKSGDKTIVVRPDSNTMTVNGAATALEAPALAIDGRILLPVRDITEALGKTVLWNNDTQIVLVADSLDIKESDAATFALIDKQFGGGKK